MSTVNTSKSAMLRDISKLKKEINHLLYEEGGEIYQLQSQLDTLNAKMTELLSWRDDMSKHITVTITTPTTGATVSGSVTVTATAVDTLGHGIVKVDFYLDDVFFATDAASPFTQTLDTTAYANGIHTLRCKSICNNAAVGWGDNSISIIINNVIPTGGTKWSIGGGSTTASYGDVVSVRILSPTPGSTVPMNFIITVSATCSAGHPIISVVNGIYTGNLTMWQLYVSFDSYTQQKKTFTITATCANGTTGTATVTYYNQAYTRY